MFKTFVTYITSAHISLLEYAAFFFLIILLQGTTTYLGLFGVLILFFCVPKVNTMINQWSSDKDKAQ